MSASGPSSWAKSSLERIQQLEGAVVDDDEHDQDRTLSVVVRTQGQRRQGLLESLTCLAAQTNDDFDVVLTVHDAPSAKFDEINGLVQQFARPFRSRVQVVVVTGGGRGRPLNVGVDHARGSYVAFLDDDDLVSTDWVDRFLNGVAVAPGSVVRCLSAGQFIQTLEGNPRPPYRAFGAPQFPFPRQFDFVRHLHRNATPFCSFALPRKVFGKSGLQFSEELDVLEDWDVLLQAASLCGVHDTGACTSLYHWPLQTGVSSTPVDARIRRAATSRIIDRLGTAPLVLPPGSARELATLAAHDDDHKRLTAALADARRRLAAKARNDTYEWTTTARGDLRRMTRKLRIVVNRRLSRAFQVRRLWNRS